MKKGTQYLAVALLLAATPSCTQSQVHPSKQVYADAEGWPVTTPADIDFSDSFQPFRAVWSREYRNMDGEARQDRVVLVAEELSWYGRPVISLTLHDAGALESPDTNARTTSVYVDRQTLSLVRATAPKSGTAEDYNVVAAREDGIVLTTVSTTTGETESKRFATAGPVFGGFNMDFLIWAGLGLQPDSRVLIHRYSPSQNAMAPDIVRVIDRESIELPNGERADAWVVERPISQPDNALVQHFRILDRAPYIASRHVIDLDSKETRSHFTLLEWELLGSD